PTVISHRTGKRSLNRVLGLIINGITTLALIASVGLLVRALPSHKEAPLELLRSGALLWLTNVIVFALWYWRLDGGGPTLRHERKKFGSTSFLFPQMQVPHDERAQFECTRWRPRFIDYLFVAFTQFPNLISLIRDIRLIRCYSNSGEHLDRYLGFSVRGMERKFLSGRSVNGEDVAVLRRTLFDHRDQLHFSPHSVAENNRELEN